MHRKLTAEFVGTFFLVVAALASAVSFVAGAILPFLTILLVPLPWRIPVTVLAVLLALALTGGLGAKLGDSPVAPAIWRVVIGGVLALGATYGIGALLGVPQRAY